MIVGLSCKRKEQAEDAGASRAVPVAPRNCWFTGTTVVSIEQSTNQASQEDRMTRKTRRISLWELVVVLLFAAAVAVSRPTPVF
jgi:hypothetical protein